MMTKNKNSKLLKNKWIKKRLTTLSIVFRSSDIYFKKFDINEKRMLNDMGKIIQTLNRLYVEYGLSNDDKKLQIRRKIANLESFINKMDIKDGKD